MLLKNRIWRVTLAFFTVCCLMSASAAQAGEKSFPILDVGKRDQILKEDGAGKVAVVSVFASWCPPCKGEMPILVKIREDTPESDLLLIGLSLDEDMRALGKFMEDYQVNFPVYLVTEDLFADIGVMAIPHTFIYNRKGKEVKSISGVHTQHEEMLRTILTTLLSEPGV